MTPEMVHPHAFRHRFAKSFIEKCGDISLLADLVRTRQHRNNPGVPDEIESGTADGD